MARLLIYQKTKGNLLHKSASKLKVLEVETLDYYATSNRLKIANKTSVRFNVIKHFYMFISVEY